MARRKSIRRQRRAVWVKWTPVLAQAFRLASSEWTPPNGAHLTQGERQQTLSARFTRPDGQVMTCRIRLRRDPGSGDLSVIGEEMTLAFAIRGPAGSPPAPAEQGNG